MKDQVPPAGVSIVCYYRVWIGDKPYCVYDVGAAVMVTKTSISYAPACNRERCPLREEIL